MCSGYISTPHEVESRRQTFERLEEFHRIVDRLRSLKEPVSWTLNEMLVLNEHVKSFDGLKGELPTQREFEILQAAERRIFHEQAI